MGERNWPSWCLLLPVGFSSIVSSALRVTGGAMVDDDCNEGCAVQTEIVLRCSARDSRYVCGQGGQLFHSCLVKLRIKTATTGAPPTEMR